MEITFLAIIQLCARGECLEEKEVWKLCIAA